MKQGDILVNKDGYKRKILGVCGEVYCVSLNDNFVVSHGWMTRDELETMGYSLLKEEWVPKEGEEYWYIDGDFISINYFSNIEGLHNMRKNGLGIYRTESEAQAVFDKLKEYVKGAMNKDWEELKHVVDNGTPNVNVGHIYRGKKDMCLEFFGEQDEECIKTNTLIDNKK